MRYAHILAKLTDSPWFITESALGAIADLLESRLISSATPVFDAGSADDSKGDSIAIDPNKTSVPVIRARGILGKHLSMMETMCGGCDYDTLASVIEDALQQPEVKAIVIAMDSPGGAAVGAAETFARIQAIRAKTGKEVWAFCDTKACSAMYYLAAACDGIVCTVTASLGCIGSMLTIEDRSGQLAAQGVRRLTIKSASMKDIGNPDRPPTPAEISELQQRIDFLGGLFKRDVLAGRGEVNPEVFAKGLTYFGDDAVKMGLADEVVPSIEDFVAALEARFDTAAVATA